MDTEAAQSTFSLNSSPFLVTPRSGAVGHSTTTTTEDISREALQTQLTKLEQIVEYLKVLYR